MATPIYRDNDEELLTIQMHTFNQNNERTYLVSQAKFEEAFRVIANNCPTCLTFIQELKTLLAQYRNQRLSENEWQTKIDNAYDMIEISPDIQNHRDFSLMKLILSWLLDRGY